MLLSSNSMVMAEQYVIGFPEDNMSNDWRAAQMNEIQNELKEMPNVRFLMADAAGSIAQNIFDIETMVDQGVQLLFLGPRNPKSVELLLSKIRKKGIYVILLTRRINTEDYDVFISPDDFQIAHDAASFLIKNMPVTGKVLMLEGVPSTTTAIQRKKGFLKGLKNNPDIQVISKVANYSRTEAISIMGELIEEGIKFDAIYAHNDAMAAGARLALKQAGIAPGQIPIVSIDYLPETRKAIINGEQLASFTYPTCGKLGVKAALELLKGKSVPRNIAVASKMVTKANAHLVETVY